MCLISKTDKPCIAEEDIVCYKMLDRENGFFCKWKTPFIGMRVRNGVVSGRRLMKAHGERKIIRVCLFDSSPIYDVFGGYIHTFNGNLFNIEAYRMGYSSCLFECVIPKGEEYYKSYYGTEYASRSIRFIKQVF